MQRRVALLRPITSANVYGQVAQFRRIRTLCSWGFSSYSAHSRPTGVVGHPVQEPLDAEPEGQGAWKRRKTTAERKAEQVRARTRATVHEC